MPHKLLVASELVKQEGRRRLERYAEVFSSDGLDREKLLALLPELDSLIVFFWPKFLTAENLAKMKKLRFIQSILVGVNHVPFEALDERVVVCSNAGAYSLEVGEHAMALLFAASKRIAEHHLRIREGNADLASFAGAAKEMVVLEGKQLGVVGYGGIGRKVGDLGAAIGMRVLAYSRRRQKARGVKFCYGAAGLENLLRSSDAVVLSVPLSNSTSGMLGERELSMMKEEAILVNIARGDLVDQRALYEWLKRNRRAVYATDAWWFREGHETLSTDYPLPSLPNFLGTPHISGLVGLLSGRPAELAVENTLRYLRGMKPRNVVRRAEYLSQAR